MANRPKPIPAPAPAPAASVPPPPAPAPAPAASVPPPPAPAPAPAPLEITDQPQVPQPGQASAIPAPAPLPEKVTGEPQPPVEHIPLKKDEFVQTHGQRVNPAIKGPDPERVQQDASVAGEGQKLNEDGLVPGVELDYATVARINREAKDKALAAQSK